MVIDWLTSGITRVLTGGWIDVESWQFRASANVLDGMVNIGLLIPAVWR